MKDKGICHSDHNMISEFDEIKYILLPHAGAVSEICQGLPDSQ